MSHNCQIHPWPLLLLEDSLSQLSSSVSIWDLVWDRIKSMHLSAVDIHLLISVTSCFLFSLFFAGSSPQPVHLPGQLRFRTTLLPRGIQPGCGWEMLTWLQPPRGLLKHALQTAPSPCQHSQSGLSTSYRWCYLSWTTLWETFLVLF